MELIYNVAFRNKTHYFQNLNFQNRSAILIFTLKLIRGRQLICPKGSIEIQVLDFWSPPPPDGELKIFYKGRNVTFKK